MQENILQVLSAEMQSETNTKETNSLIISMLTMWTSLVIEKPELIKEFYNWKGTDKIEDPTALISACVFNNKWELVKQAIKKAIELISEKVSVSEGEQPLVFFLNTLIKISPSSSLDPKE